MRDVFKIFNRKFSAFGHLASTVIPFFHALSLCGSVHRLLSAHVIWLQLVLSALEEGLIGLITQQVLPLAIVTGLHVEMTQWSRRERDLTLSNCWEKAFSFLFHIEQRMGNLGLLQTPFDHKRRTNLRIKSTHRRQESRAELRGRENWVVRISFEQIDSYSTVV